MEGAWAVSWNSFAPSGLTLALPRVLAEMHPFEGSHLQLSEAGGCSFSGSPLRPPSPGLLCWLCDGLITHSSPGL